MTGEPFAMEVDGGPKMRVGGGGEIEFDGVENWKRLSLKFMIFAKSRKQAFRSAFLASETKDLILL